ncbi:pyridoxal phosphate-dependent aminotransferase family protein [Phytohabitans sp. ZYX-F-186]|uniref:8-amino-7-oxononanoate synthase n=1 Tax=Phytohabitans maris TaxID=3071409 RepID=A0ABU0ZWB0_9ACTN|nr:pyridoxal phosphate-dependent aminotransferase family protein [Phytohabitans sp. ZYX-F-186]MDQ7910614.1 pyridoxal phosphate-dependent aminotransferase family protein [Phytohabitans sp. ZYX-F-186]
MGTSTYVARWSDLERLLATNPMMDAVIDEVRGREIRVGDHWLVDFASCNYLGFDLDPEIQAAIAPAVEKWGTHPSWSRMLGSPALYPQIEERLADLLGAPDALVLPTVTLIHMAVVPVLAGTGTVIYEHNAHRTIYDACQYARGLGATTHRFRGGDVTELERLLRAAPTGAPRLVCVDGVNSMTGNPPDLGAYARLCREYGALLYVDDAHGFGLVGERRPDETSPYGARGNAVVRWRGESYDNIVLVGGFSKAYSSLLAFIAVPTEVKQHLKVAAPPYLYSGPSPTASLATVLAGFDVNDARGDRLRGRLYGLTARVLDRVRALGVATPNTSGTPIVELPLAAGRDLSAVASELWRRGIYVTLAAYPLVSRADVGLRVQLTAAHTDADIDRLLDALDVLAARGDLRAAAGPATPRQPGPGPES